MDIVGHVHLDAHLGALPIMDMTYGAYGDVFLDWS
jgi:hypothetical protein